MAKSVERTSFRSAIHATDSTCAGWMAKSAATKALGQTAAVIRRSAAKRKQALRAWKIALTTR